MTSTDIRSDSTRAAAAVPPEVAPPGNPALIGVPTFVVGALALGLVLTGYVPGTATAASIPIILSTTAIGQLVAAIWAASLAQNALAAIFGTFAGFWLSYAVLVLGLTNNWFGLSEEDAVGAQKLFLLTWLIVIVLLTLSTLHMPLAFTVLFTLIDLALLFVFIGTANASTTATQIGGYFVFSFTLVGAYLFVDAMGAATGGRSLPMGRAVLH
ncbi:hypothetical protein GCM10007304_31890 [Rhodococcoides trifolii]|uniref:Uncharacterized protein n=1 Tax=Rhodococcoides trifolii TaxID=908250 RepID=A0A917FZL6_9NOCA|nr:GPR1/FUN34/YaaH family transporter [Rhodococcus trifolii]GGG15427.1 hypothetical protein GCM10007304_31890 [Rhodococcus trifolii]